MLPATLAGKEHLLAQGALLHGCAFIKSLANVTNFEEKSLCPQAARASGNVCKAERGAPLRIPQ